MTNVMPPSDKKKTTSGQIDRAVARYRALLEKEASKLDLDAVQKTLSQDETHREMVNLFRKRTDMNAKTIVRRVRVNRNRNPKEAISVAALHDLYQKSCEWSSIDEEVLTDMPRGQGKEAEVWFFQLMPDEYQDEEGGLIRNNEVHEVLQKALKRRNLKSADPYSLTAANEASPDFYLTHSNMTTWVDESGEICSMTFESCEPYGIVIESRVPYMGDDYSEMWFAGIR